MGAAPFQLIGASDGPLAVYFHGAPGGPQEALRFDDAARQAGVRLALADRVRIAPGETGEAYWAALAGAVDHLAAEGPVSLVGFSIGAFAALQVAGRIRTPPCSVDLVSAAGPLESGDFLDAMAGAPVFRLARVPRGVFAAVVAAQGALVRLIPDTVVRTLFQGVTGAEAALAGDRAFRAEVAGLLALSYGADRDGFVRDLQLYVQPWAGSLAQLRGPARLWHGSADTWTPPAMAERLVQLLPQGSGLAGVAGQGHFSTLFETMPGILQRVGRGA